MTHILFSSITKRHYELKTADKPLMFTGVLIAKASNYGERLSNCGKWNEQKLFLLNSGRYVCYSLESSNDETKYSVLICKSKDQALKSFGKTRLGRSLRGSERLNRPKAKNAMSISSAL